MQLNVDFSLHFFLLYVKKGFVSVFNTSGL